MKAGKKSMADEKDEHSYTNRLIHEKSPYLLMHAHNPVDWYPWGEEAFSASRSHDKPIFLSIGYATCHWCHTMERESFENPEIANLMNEAFINIKVDREELPEVDGLYMEFAQSMMAGAAGWPLNVLLTPELQPFFATTYMPPRSRLGLLGLSDLITRIREVWHSEERERLVMQASKIVEVFSEIGHNKGDELPLKEQIDGAADLLFKMADPVYGGIKGMPKFPIGYQMSFLLAFSHKTKDSRALFLAERTLDMMHRGGIYDHLGGGFARYSVDEKWFVPHFEKMLYDNAILAISYLDAWHSTQRSLYKEVCMEILQYILRDMTHPEGGFFSAEDSESEGQEGKFYTWKKEEINRILGPSHSDLFCEFYDVREEGNFERRNILHTHHSLEEFAKIKNLVPEELKETIKLQSQLLWKVREGRVHPFKDDKIITSWNGMMIHSLVLAGLVFEKSDYVKAAEKAARFIQMNLWQEGRLLRRWRDDEALHDAGLEDYAYMIRASLSLFEATGETDWLRWAVEMATILKQQFKIDQGAFYQTNGKDESILLRRCQFSDGAEPSGNAVHGENLLRLYQITGDENYLNQAEDILRAVNRFIQGYSPGYIYHMMDLQWYYDKQAPTLVVALNKDEENRDQISKLIYKQYIPHKAVIWKKLEDQKLDRLAPLVHEYKPLKEQTTLYICHRGVCEEPLVNLQEMEKALTTK